MKKMLRCQRQLEDESETERMARNDKLKRVLVALLATTLLLGACGDKTEESESETETAVQTETETEVETESETETETETETEVETEAHTHNYKLSDTVQGTCLELGYRRFACTCGLSYKELIPATHKYKEVTDTTGNYIKKVCTACGDYKIIRKQSYLYNITFETGKTAQEATNNAGGRFYTISGGTVDIKKGTDGNYGLVKTANYCVYDKAGAVKSGSKFIISMDVKYTKIGTTHSLIAFGIHYKNGETAFGNGVVSVGADGTLQFCHNGDGKNTKAVRLSDKGYNNITIVGDLKSGLFDIYVNEELVRSKVQYNTKLESGATDVYVRYFDREKQFEAQVDNIKLYQGTTPEFIVPTSGIVFKG